MNIQNMPRNYYGVSSFDSISSGNQKKKNAAMQAIYSAGSQTSQLNGLTSAIGNLKSAVTAVSDPKAKEELNVKIGNITSSMKNSFHLVDESLLYQAPDTRSLNEMAKDQADIMMKKYNAGAKIDELI